MKYSLTKRKLPVAKNGQKELYYASPVSHKTVSMKELCELMAKHTTVSKADILAVLEQLADSLRYLISLGMNVELGEIGYFRASFRSEGVVDVTKFDPRLHIRQPQIKFMMKRNFKELSDIRYEYVEAKSKTQSNKPSGSDGGDGGDGGDGNDSGNSGGSTPDTGGHAGI